MNKPTNTAFLYPFFVFSLFIPKYGSAQMLDSIRLSFNQKWRFVVGVDSRNSFISNERAEILGLKAGVQFGKKIEIGISGHLMNGRNSHFYKNYAVTSPSNTTEIVKAQLKLFYIAYYAEYIFFNNKYWKFSVPLQLGIGRSSYVYTYNQRDTRSDKHLVLIYEPIISTEYKIFRWLSATAEIGYRIMLFNNPAIKENFNSPTYSLGVSISFTELYKICFPKSQFAKHLDISY